MTRPLENQRDALARYKALQAGALSTSLVLSVVAIAANALYPSSPWFLAGNALAGAFLFLSWHHHATLPEGGNALFPVVAITSAVLGLAAEFDRPLSVSFACGLSVLGAVMFGLLEISRRRQRKGG